MTELSPWDEWARDKEQFESLKNAASYIHGQILPIDTIRELLKKRWRVQSLETVGLEAFVKVRSDLIRALI